MSHPLDTEAPVTAETAAAAAAGLAVFNTHLRDLTRHADTKAGQGLAVVLVAAAAGPVVLPRLPLVAHIIAAVTLAVVLTGGVVLAAVYQPRGIAIEVGTVASTEGEAIARVLDPKRALRAAAAESVRLKAVLHVKHRLIDVGFRVLGAGVFGLAAAAAAAGVAALV